MILKRLRQCLGRAGKLMAARYTSGPSCCSSTEFAVLVDLANASAEAIVFLEETIGHLSTIVSTLQGSLESQSITLAELVQTVQNGRENPSEAAETSPSFPVSPKKVTVH
jgi:hypothetical protein